MVLQSNPEVEHPEPEPELEIESDNDDDSSVGEGMTDEEIKDMLTNTYRRSSNKPMRDPHTASWVVPISEADWDKFQAGSRAQDMDERWNLLVERLDEKGGISLHIMRSWTQEDCYIVHFVPEDEGGAKIQGITWEGEKNYLQLPEEEANAEQAKKDAVILSRMILHCELEAVPQYPTRELHFSSKVDRE
ncbi:hypothetical protein K461DRAFT_275412 [Myriangium duriaei CBS 260.36]|uniref:Uncharacterized protein n=1 Tax=Myriangium duriaei CBS 260.36 TaxID=1168546 RepID=A0A9P4J6J4_9PEZI|nr:hypothetical protein K461DRAFT_275412 [Myriangium duriaei CBS 260.36]